MKLIDTKARAYCPTSRFLTKEEINASDKTLNFKKHRMSFIFKNRVPLVVEGFIGKLLMVKYSYIEEYKENKPKKVVPVVEDVVEEVVVDKEESSLEDMNYTDLKKMGMKLGLTFKEVAVKKADLITLVMVKMKDNS